MAKLTRYEKEIRKREKRRRRKEQNFETHLNGETLKALVDKLIAGEVLTDEEELIKARMPRLIPKLITYRKNGPIAARTPNVAATSVASSVNVVKLPAVREKYGLHTAFYQSEQWRRLRYAAIVRSNGRCLACGASASTG